MDKFSSFCSRMYLDYSDETSDPLSERLSKEEYIRKYNKWLLQEYAKYKEEQ